MKSDAFSDQVVIVTGASAGIGKAMALLLASQKANVVIAARRVERLEQVAAECRQYGAETLVIPTDVSKEEQCKTLVERTVKTYGRLDMLINNAGLAVSGLFEEFSDLNWFKHVMDVNFYGAVYCTYYALPYLKQTKGRLVAISSLGGKAAIPLNTPYIASKFAMEGFFDSLRMELRKHGISVTVICPWWVVTEFHEAQMDKNGVTRGSGGRSVYTKKMMSAERCAEITLGAAYKRRREVLMGPGAISVWLKVFAPEVLDWISGKVLEDAIRRVRANQEKPKL